MWAIARQYLETIYFCHHNLDSKDWTLTKDVRELKTKPFLTFKKMDNIIRIETLCYAKICGKRRLVHEKTPQEKEET